MVGQLAQHRLPGQRASEYSVLLTGRGKKTQNTFIQICSSIIYFSRKKFENKKPQIHHNTNKMLKKPVHLPLWHKEPSTNCFFSWNTTGAEASAIHPAPSAPLLGTQLDHISHAPCQPDGATDWVLTNGKWTEVMSSLPQRRLCVLPRPWTQSDYGEPWGWQSQEAWVPDWAPGRKLLHRPKTSLKTVVWVQIKSYCAKPSCVASMCYCTHIQNGYLLH